MAIEGEKLTENKRGPKKMSIFILTWLGLGRVGKKTLSLSPSLIIKSHHVQKLPEHGHCQGQWCFKHTDDSISEKAGGIEE